MSVWGIIPAAGIGSRIQPLAFSKELLPVGSHSEGLQERPRAVSEYLVERMTLAGATKICFVIAPGKSDIVEYYGSKISSADVFYAVQPRPTGLCDAVFRAVGLIHHDDTVCVGLPDTIWFPDDGFLRLDDRLLSFLLFPVAEPQHFDAVITAEDGRVLEIQVKHPCPTTDWIWGAFKMPGAVFLALHDLWNEPGKRDEYFGTLVNEYVARGGPAYAVRGGTDYVDVGTLQGYRQAIRLLEKYQQAGVVHA
jgi:dTDP-glucose pyrophosphorylase